MLSYIAYLLALITILPLSCLAQGVASDTGGSIMESDTTILSLEGLDQFVMQVQRNWSAPGIAIGIVQDGKTIYLKGFGYRDIDNHYHVTPNTLFSIASSTKSFTATGIGVLLDEGKVSWDTPVRECLSWFQLKDPVASQYTTVRDMLCHRTGLPAHTLMQFSIAKQFDRREIARRLRYLEPNHEFRSLFQYQNQMYQVATVIIEELSGQRWEEFTRQRLFEPLEMHRSRFSQAHPTGQEDDVAFMYELNENSDLVRLPSMDPFLKEISGSGAIYSSAREMCNWLLMNLNNGTLGNQQVVSPSTLNALHTPQVVIPGTLLPEVLHQTYTLGWNAMVYRGHILLNRPGGAPGIASQVVLLPADDIGVVILANHETSTGHLILTFDIIDRLLQLEPIPWLERLWPFEAGARQYAQQMRQPSKASLPDAPPTRPLEAFTGNYENPGYGLITITHEQGELFLDFVEKLPLRHLHNNVFEGFQLYRFFEFRFETDMDGDIASIVAPLEPPVSDIVFRRIEQN